MSFISQVICGWKGHIPEKFLTETDEYIKTKRCKRCKRPLGIGHWKIVIEATPPWLSDQEWAMFCEHQNQEIRNGV